MAKLILPAFICLLAFAGCKKTAGNTEMPKTPDSPAQYTISGLRDTIVMYTDDSAVYSLTFMPAPGKQEELYLSATGLPEGLIAIFDRSQATPPFSAKITVKSINIQPGFYNVEFNAIPSKGDGKEWNTLFHVLPRCGKIVEGIYINHEIITDGGTLILDTTIETRVLSDNRNKVFFENLFYPAAFQSDTDLSIILNCANDSMDGYGYYTSDTFNIYLKFQTGPPPSYNLLTCTMTRK